MEQLFIEAKSTADVKKAVEKAINLLPKKVGIVTTAQHKHKLNEVKEILEKNKRLKGNIMLFLDKSPSRMISDINTEIKEGEALRILMVTGGG